MRLLLVIITLLFTSCSTDVVDPRVETYKTIDYVSTLGSDVLSGLIPQDAIIHNDTLYVLTRDTLNSSTLELFQFSSGEHLTSFKTWNYSDGTLDSLYSGMTISIFDSLLCIGGENSRVDIFDRSTLTYKSTIGNGNWWGDESTLIVHSFALAVVNELFVIRDKHNLRIYSVADLTEENRKKVPLVAKSISLGGNGSKRRFGMALLGDFLYVTDNPNKSIERFATTDIVSGSMEITPVDTIVLESRPYDISSHDNLLYIPTDNKEILVYNPETSEFKEKNSIVGHVFESPQTLLFTNDDFCIVETESNSVVLGKVNYHELSIYE